MGLAIGVDVGGTKIAAGVVDEHGRIIDREHADSPTEADAVEQAITDVVTTLQERHAVECVGIGAAALVGSDRATVVVANNLALRSGPGLKLALESSTGLPVVIENDANAAAWAEVKFGVARDADDLLLITIGTGVGGGLVVDGQLLRGGFGVAGEIGHVRIERDGRPCTCGQRGCLEQYASGTALVRSARAAASADPAYAATLLDSAGGDVESITGPMVTEAALGGDAFSVDQLAELGGWLGEGIATMAAVVDPSVVVLGGGVAEAGELLRAPVEAAFRANLTASEDRPHAEFRLAELGNSAGLVGAADLARR